MLQEFLHRIGTFLMLISIGILILFVASISSNAVNYDYLFWAALAGLLGFFLRRKRPEPEPTGRFRLLKRFQRPRRGRKER